MTATLIVSLSGLDEAHLDDCARFVDDLDARRVPTSWLLPPRPPAGRHRRDSPAVEFLRTRLTAGDALVMHGYDHTADPIGCWRPAQLARIGRKAEFAALPDHEAGLRLVAANRALRELGLATDVFAPPRWLASAGTLTALRRAGFRVCADAAGVRLLVSGLVLRGRVLEVGPADGAESLRCRGLLVTAARSARRGHLVRLAVGAGDLARPVARQALLDAVDAALAAHAVPADYATPVAPIQALSA